MIKKLDPEKESHPEFLDSIFELYKAGAPCHSSLFHKHEKFRTLPKETQVEKCVIKCKGTKFACMQNVLANNKHHHTTAKFFKSTRILQETCTAIIIYLN